MRSLTILMLVSLVVLPALSQEETNKSLHSDGDGWGLKIVRPEGEKSVLLIGNSICNGYKEYVAKELPDYKIVAWVNPYHLKSEHLFNDLIKVLKSEKWDVVHFNIGLHGWPEGRIPKGMYQPLLQNYVDTLKKYSSESKLIWASITPVTNKEKPYTINSEINPVIADRNMIAGIVMKNNGIPVNDLYSLCLLNLQLARGDRFHWTAAMYRMIAIQTAAIITYELEIN